MAALQNAQSAGAGSLKLCPGAGRPLVFVDELTASPFALECLCWANPRSGTTDLTCPEPPGACADTQPNGWACSPARARWRVRVAVGRWRRRGRWTRTPAPDAGG